MYDDDRGQSARDLPPAVGDGPVHARLRHALVAGRRAPGRPATRDARAAVLRLRLGPVGRRLHGGRRPHGSRRRSGGARREGEPVGARELTADVAVVGAGHLRPHRGDPARRAGTGGRRARGTRPRRRASLEHGDRRRGERARRRVGRAVPDAAARAARRPRDRALSRVPGGRERVRGRGGRLAPLHGPRAGGGGVDERVRRGRGEARHARQGARPGGAVGAPGRRRARLDDLRGLAPPRGGRRRRPRPSPLVARGRVPDEARAHVLAPPGAVGDRGRRRRVRALRGRAVPRVPGGRRLAADAAPPRRAARRARAARLARA